MTRRTITRHNDGGTRAITPPLGTLRDELDTIFDRFMRSPLGLPIDVLGSSTAWPSLDVSETKEAVKVTAEVPGIPAENVQVEVEGGTLVISGEVSEEKTSGDEHFHHVERRRGEFRRVIALPDTVDPERITAEASDGVLTVTLPKRADAGGRRIEVKPRSAGD